MESNELLSKVLAENIEKVSGGVGAAIDFTIEQAPEVIQQVLMWNATLSAAKCLSGVMIIILTIIAAKLYIKAFTDKARGNEIVDHPELVFLVVPIVFSATMINLTWLKIWIAPKVWLIEYAASLVK